jgi:DMSO/TMAO reductase YedYZ molybdopterin-dependent catalytic subunit
VERTDIEHLYSWRTPLGPDVLMADQMNGEALSFEHGAPLRLIAPSHYAYKSVKHITEIEFWSEFKPGPGLLEHPRARVGFEERGRLMPGRLLRSLYRPLIAPVTSRFRVRGP